MKLTVLVFSSCYLLILSSPSHFAAAQPAIPNPPPVLDIDGKNLQAGVKYYILPVYRGFGGGLTLSTFTKNRTFCQRGVVQESFEVKPGTPLSFTPVNHEKGGVIRISTDLNIKFSKIIDKSCSQSYVWKVEFDEVSGNYFVETGGVEGNPGRETVSNWFKIEKLDRDYKLFFCPTVCSFCKVICKDIGVFFQSEKRRLALSDSPLLLQFKKASSH